MTPPREPHRKHAKKARASLWVTALAVAALLIGPDSAAANDPLGLDLMTLGKAIPRFDLPPIENGKPGLSDDDLAGKVSLLNVWASWCPPCRDEHPVLMKLAERDLVPLYGINFKDGSASASHWLRKYGDPYVRNGFDADGRVAAELGLFGLPQTFVIDAARRVVYVHKGALTDENVARIIVPLVERLSSQSPSTRQPAEP